MANSKYTSAERHLQRSMRFNLDNGILPSENKIIADMLDRPKDMRPVYDDFRVSEITNPEQGRELDSIVCWLFIIDSREFRQAPEAINEVLGNKSTKRKGLNKQIQENLKELAALYRQRDVYQGLGRPDDYHVIDWISAGLDKSDPGTSHRGNSYVMPALDALRTEFDLKYWPEPAAIFEALADMQDDETDIDDPAIKDSLGGQRGHDKRALSYLLSAIDQAMPGKAKRIRASSIAALLSIVDIEYGEIAIQKARQRR